MQLMKRVITIVQNVIITYNYSLSQSVKIGSYVCSPNAQSDFFNWPHLINHLRGKNKNFLVIIKMY